MLCPDLDQDRDLRDQLLISIGQESLLNLAVDGLIIRHYKSFLFQVIICWCFHCWFRNCLPCRAYDSSAIQID